MYPSVCEEAWCLGFFCFVGLVSRAEVLAVTPAYIQINKYNSIFYIITQCCHLLQLIRSACIRKQLESNIENKSVLDSEVQKFKNKKGQDRFAVPKKFLVKYFTLIVIKRLQMCRNVYRCHTFPFSKLVSVNIYVYIHIQVLPGILTTKCLIL